MKSMKRIAPAANYAQRNAPSRPFSAKSMFPILSIKNCVSNAISAVKSVSMMPLISIDFHHVDGKNFVVPLPTEIHRKIGGNGNHIKTANDWIEFYYGIHPNEFLGVLSDAES